MIWLLIAGIAVSYGWGMRGTLLGHGQGAMLPGALLGICIAFLSGDPLMSEAWLYLAALGAAGMYFGGGMTYGETIGFVIRKEGQRLWHGVTGLAWKGFLWFGLAGAYLAVGIRSLFSAMYSPAEIILAALMPVVLCPVGEQLLNRPWDKEAGRFPRIYFSRTRRESWGGYLLTLLGLLILAAVKEDVFSVLMMLISAVGGAIGWMAAILFYYISEYPLKNGKYLFGRLSELKLVSGWKLMECTLGAIGGVMTCVAFLVACAVQDPVWEQWGAINSVSSADILPVVVSPVLSGTTELLVVLLWLALAAFDIWFERFRFGDQYNALASHTKNADIISQTIYGSMALVLVMLGSKMAAAETAGTLIFWVLADKLCLESLRDLKGIRLLTIVFALCAGVMVILPLAGVFFPLWGYVALYTAVYESMALVRQFRARTWGAAKENGLVATYSSYLTVHGYFLIAILLIGLLMVWALP